MATDRLTDIKARLADTGAVRQSDATWLVEQLEQARTALAAHVQTEDDIRTLLAAKDLPTGPAGDIAWDLGMAVLAHLDFPEPETPDEERLAGLRALTEQLRERNAQRTEQVEQARRIAVELQQQLDLATELRIPTADGGGIIITRQIVTGLWSVRDDGLRFWIDGDWRPWRDALRGDDAFIYPLHEALDIAQQLAAGEFS